MSSRYLALWGILTFLLVGVAGASDKELKQSISAALPLKFVTQNVTMHGAGLVAYIKKSLLPISLKCVTCPGQISGAIPSLDLHENCFLVENVLLASSTKLLQKPWATITPLTAGSMRISYNNVEYGETCVHYDLRFQHMKVGENGGYCASLTDRETKTVSAEIIITSSNSHSTVIARDAAQRIIMSCILSDKSKNLLVAYPHNTVLREPPLLQISLPKNYVQFSSPLTAQTESESKGRSHLYEICMYSQSRITLALPCNVQGVKGIVTCNNSDGVGQYPSQKEIILEKGKPYLCDTETMYIHLPRPGKKKASLKRVEATVTSPYEVIVKFRLRKTEEYYGAPLLYHGKYAGFTGGVLVSSEALLDDTEDEAEWGAESYNLPVFTPLFALAPEYHLSFVAVKHNNTMTQWSIMAQGMSLKSWKLFHKGGQKYDTETVFDQAPADWIQQAITVKTAVPKLILPVSLSSSFSSLCASSSTSISSQSNSSSSSSSISSSSFSAPLVNKATYATVAQQSISQNSSSTSSSLRSALSVSAVVNSVPYQRHSFNLRGRGRPIGRGRGE